MKPNARVPALALLLAVAGAAASSPVLANPSERVDSRQSHTHGIFDIRVSGWILIAEDGTVEGLNLKPSLGKAIDQALAERVRSWRFEPVTVDGRPAKGRTGVKIDLEARPVPGKSDKMETLMDSVTFHTLALPGVSPGLSRGESEGLTLALQPPRYPSTQLRANVGARVIAIVKLDEQGKVVDLAFKSLDLRSAGSMTSSDSNRHAEAFKKRVLEAAEHWRLQGLRRCGQPCLAQVPVFFSFSGEPSWMRRYTVAQSLPAWAQRPERIVSLDASGQLETDLTPTGPLVDGRAL